MDRNEMIRKSIGRIARSETEKANRSCFRVYKAIVKVAPNFSTGLCGVSLIGDETVLSLPFTNAVSGVSVGDIVLVSTTFNSFSNAVVWSKPDLNAIPNGLLGYELIGNGENNSPVWKKPAGYLLCPVPGSNPAKAVSFDNFKLTQGVVINVVFLFAHNSATEATLNIGGTGAKPIVWHNTGYTITASTTGSPKMNSWNAGEILTLVYDGSYWRIISRTNPTFYSVTGSEPAVYNNLVEIASIKVAAGKVYSITANVQSNTSLNSVVLAQVEITDSSGNQIAEFSARTSGSAGGGATVAAITNAAVSQTSFVTLRLRSYGYENSTYNLYGYLNAVTVVE